MLRLLDRYVSANVDWLLYLRDQVYTDCSRSAHRVHHLAAVLSVQFCIPIEEINPAFMQMVRRELTPDIMQL